MSNQAPDGEQTPDERHARALLARRVEFVLIGIGGAFLIFGWGFNGLEWARALGWILTGIGFAIEMVYGKVIRPAPKSTTTGQAAEQPTEAASRVPDESAS